MARHPVFLIPSPLANGFDVVAQDGKTYLRLIVRGRATHAVPQTAAELRMLAASLLNAADAVDQEAGHVG